MFKDYLCLIRRGCGASDPLQGAFVLTEELKALAAAQEDAPPWIADAQGVAFGVSLTAGLAIRASMDQLA